VVLPRRGLGVAIRIFSGAMYKEWEWELRAEIVPGGFADWPFAIKTSFKSPN
jgi:hypothetical protein